MRYVEYALQPELRSGLMVPVSSLPDIFNRADSGYCSVYQFDESAKFAIKAQGDAVGLSRFSVYSERLWLDIDAADSSPQEVERVKIYVRQLTNQFRVADYAFSVWFSGSKGYHICIKIVPMTGIDVPYSQSQFVQNVLKIQCDFSLYQHARLLSNPGRLHPKTGIKKHKIFEFNGGTLLSVPYMTAPKRPIDTLNSLTDSDLARIALSRLSSLALDSPLPGMRHTSYWGAASQCMEAGLKSDLVFGLLCWINKMSPSPKDESEVQRAVNQAAHQLGLK